MKTIENFLSYLFIVDDCLNAMCRWRGDVGPSAVVVGMAPKNPLSVQRGRPSPPSRAPPLPAASGKESQQVHNFSSFNREFLPRTGNNKSVSSVIIIIKGIIVVSSFVCGLIRGNHLLETCDIENLVTITI